MQCSSLPKSQSVFIVGMSDRSLIVAFIFFKFYSQRVLYFRLYRVLYHQLSLCRSDLHMQRERLKIYTRDLFSISLTFTVSSPEYPSHIRPRLQNTMNAEQLDAYRLYTEWNEVIMYNYSQRLLSQLSTQGERRSM
jgi:hypothetical protein